MSRNEKIRLCVSGIIVAIVLGVVLILKLIDTAQAIQIAISFVLILITAIYVERTADIAQATRRQAQATKEQADASVKMAEEMREQRYAENLPLLVPHVLQQWNTQGMEPNEIPYEYLSTGIGIVVIWRNVGKGAAINSQFSFWTAPKPSGQVEFFAPHELETLAVSEQWEVDYGRGLRRRPPATPEAYYLPLDSNNMFIGELRDVSGGDYPHLLAEYQDICERRITTVQEFRIDEQKRRAFLGKLYFTINDRRLGEEVTQHD